MTKEYAFDALMFIVMGVFLSAVIWFGYQELYIKFAVIPMVIFYFIGKFSQRKFGSKPDTSKK